MRKEIWQLRQSKWLLLLDALDVVFVFVPAEEAMGRAAELGATPFEAEVRFSA